MTRFQRLLSGFGWPALCGLLFALLILQQDIPPLGNLLVRHHHRHKPVTLKAALSHSMPPLKRPPPRSSAFTPAALCTVQIPLKMGLSCRAHTPRTVYLNDRECVPASVLVSSSARQVISSPITTSSTMPMTLLSPCPISGRHRPRSSVPTRKPIWQC